MRMAHVYAVVLGGGRGERFWPVSTGAEPKAFLCLVGSDSLLQATIGRVRSLLPWSQILVVAGRAHADLIRQQLPELPEANVLLEPFGKDTAAAIGLASLHLERLDPEAVMVVLPADHHIPDREAFAVVVRRALELLDQRPTWVVTIGIAPGRPETGYGYLEAGEAIADIRGAFRVRRFLEKPDLKNAERFVWDGGYYWNSGIFFWRNATIQDLLARHVPEAWAALCRIREAWGVEEVLIREFSGLRRLSVDHGVLERMSGALAMVRGDFAWDDLGSWDAVARVLPAGENGNVIVGKVHRLDTTGSIIVATDQPVATLGVSNMIVVASKDGILVCARGRSQEVKRLVGDDQ